MPVAWRMLFTFVAGLSVFHIIGIDSPSAVFTGARLLILACFLVGLGYTLHSRRYALAFSHTCPGEDQIRAKSLAIRIGLLALLLYPTLMARLLPEWPTAVFNFEFLIVLPILLLATPYYVRWAEERMPRANDGYFCFGQAILRQRSWRMREHKALLLAWAVKLFFIPLMYSWLVTAVEMLLVFDWRLHPGVLVSGLFSFGLCIDLLIAASGYFFASRLLGNDVLSTDATLLGWLSCVICYPPLLGILHAVKQQTDDLIWSDWLHSHEPLYWLWAALITASWLAYWLSTVSFGLRFSNLSWRGLVDTGLYRYTKHPAYLSKNIYWWLYTVPFVGVENTEDMLRNVLGLSFVSLVYYMRARTEERHLLAFEEYAAYAARIEQEGLFARFNRRLRRIMV